MTSYERADPKREQAIAELEGMIRAKYPDASFAIRQGIDDPEETWLATSVDLDDPDAVMDLVLDRLLEIQLDEGTAVYVLPLRTPGRTAAIRRRATHDRDKVASLPPALPASR